MGARRKKEYSTGEASNYVTRKRAMQKLQLNLKDFRRLCILKGIHPREPRNRKRAQKGNMSKIQTLFHEKDIRFLLHEPIVNKFRDFKVFLKKLKKAHDKGNLETADRLKGNKPKYTLDHIVKERYPTFVDAVRDLEDCLCLCFLYSTFPKNPKTPVEMVQLCKKLTTEFMLYVIESKSLRKVFVSIKGYYYQAEIAGQIVTWVVPHNFAYDHPANVDLKLMSIFVEFYTTVLGFINYRLYHQLNLQYPPSLAAFSASTSEDTEDSTQLNSIVSALSQPLARTVTNMDDDDAEIDDIPITDDQDKMEEARQEAEQVRNLQKLFKGSRFFLGREIPRQTLVFMIRSFGGEVSWDGDGSDGSTFKEDDERITHQICDRPKESLDLKHVGRDYIQPQWVFDSINQRKMAPVHKYFVGAVLPPHLSPFIADRRVGDYIPPEEKVLLGLEEEKEGEEDAEKQEDNSEEGEEEEEEESEEEEDDDEDEEEEEENKMEVVPGKREVVDPEAQKKAEEEEEFKLRTMMIKKKHRGLYKSMMKSRKRRVHESKQLERKRADFDAKAKEKKVGKAK